MVPKKDTEQTFGSRPGTAVTEQKSEIADNSMVHVGQMTAEKRNDLIGNKF